MQRLRYDFINDGSPHGFIEGHSNIFGIGNPANTSKKTNGVWDTSADVVPKHDEWGPDGYWGCSDWTAWHKNLVAKFGKDDADSRWANEYDKSGYASHEIICSTGNQAFKDYVIAQGLHKKSTILTKVYRAEATIDAIGAPFRNIGGALTSTTKTIKWLLPALLIATAAGMLFIGYKKYAIA